MKDSIVLNQIIEYANNMMYSTCDDDEYNKMIKLKN